MKELLTIPTTKFGDVTATVYANRVCGIYYIVDAYFENDDGIFTLGPDDVDYLNNKYSDSVLEKAIKRECYY